MYSYRTLIKKFGFAFKLSIILYCFIDSERSEVSYWFHNKRIFALNVLGDTLID